MDRSFTYDLNQIPYDHTVEVKKKIQGIKLAVCLKNYGWRFIQ